LAMSFTIIARCMENLSSRARWPSPRFHSDAKPPRLILPKQIWIEQYWSMGTNTTSPYNMHCGVAVLVNCPSIVFPQSRFTNHDFCMIMMNPNHPQSLADNFWLSDFQSAPQHWSPRRFSAEWCSHCRPRWCCGFKHLGVQLVLLMGNGKTVMIQYNTPIGI
jgi:hypothetical protein